MTLSLHSCPLQRKKGRVDRQTPRNELSKDMVDTQTPRNEISKDSLYRQTPRNEISVENTNRFTDDELIQICSHLPKKTLYKLKCVSKQWCRLISNLPCMVQRATDAGFLLQIFFHSTSTMRWHFYGANEKRGIAMLGKSVNFRPGFPPWILDSCNGLILCATTPKKANKMHLSVFNPTSAQLVQLPQLPTTRVQASKLSTSPATFLRSNKSTGYGLLFHVPYFQVIQFSIVREETIVVELDIFSSETSQWKEHRPVLLCPSPIPNERFTLKRSTIYLNGALHWIWGGTVLIYNLKNDYFKFIELPKSSSRNVVEGTLAKLVWGSEGHLHYCHGGYNGICIWVLVENGYTTHNWGRIKWQVKHSIHMTTLKSQNPEVFDRMEKRTPPSIRFFEPFAYNEDMQILYIRVFHTLFCYSAEKGELKEAAILPMNEDSHYDMYPFQIWRKNSATTNGTKMGCKLEEDK
ncbi:hypothetical protein ACLOJK_023833 [Asimina triloba]